MRSLKAFLTRVSPLSLSHPPSCVSAPVSVSHRSLVGFRLRWRRALIVRQALHLQGEMNSCFRRSHERRHCPGARPRPHPHPHPRLRLRRLHYLLTARLQQEGLG